MNNTDNAQRSDSQKAEQAKGKPRFRVLETFLNNQAPLRRFISRFLVSAQDIDDIAQEAFLRAYESEKKKRIDEPKAFLFRIARNLMLSELNKKSHKITDYIEDVNDTEGIDQGLLLEDDVAAQQKLGILCEAVATLPPQCRKVFLLKKVYGLSHKEIAAHLNLSISTIEKHLVKGMRQCKGIIETRYENTLGTAEQAVPSVNDGVKVKG